MSKLKSALKAMDVFVRKNIFYIIGLVLFALGKDAAAAAMLLAAIYLRLDAYIEWATQSEVAISEREPITLIPHGLQAEQKE